jgi:hypothetical protein
LAAEAGPRRAGEAEARRRHRQVGGCETHPEQEGKDDECTTVGHAGGHAVAVDPGALNALERNAGERPVGGDAGEDNFCEVLEGGCGLKMCLPMDG